MPPTQQISSDHASEGVALKLSEKPLLVHLVVPAVEMDNCRCFRVQLNARFGKRLQHVALTSDKADYISYFVTELSLRIDGNIYGVNRSFKYALTRTAVLGFGLLCGFWFDP